MRKCDNKVLLINPEDSRNKLNFEGIIVNEPLDLEVIYTVLKDNNIKVYFYDFLISQKQTLYEVIKKLNPNYIIANANVNQIPFVFEYFETAKKIDSNIKTILTGNYVEHNYKSIKSKYLDFISRSYDPKCILNIINNKKIKDINGLCYKEKGVWNYNNLTSYDINELPLVNRTHFYKNKDKYRYLELLGACQIRTSYSCPYNCNFCYRTSLNCGKYKTKDITKVVDEIESIKSDNIYIVDDDFLFNKKRLYTFVEEIKKRKIKKQYICYGRVDFIINNKDIIKQLKEIGFYYILVGLEAINDNFLNDYNKLIGEENNKECVRFLNEIGINCMGMFIIDLNFKRKDFFNLYKWIYNNDLKHVAVSIFTPMPGTELYNEYKSKLITNDLTKWDFLHLVAKPKFLGKRQFYFYYYILVIKLFRLAIKNKIYDFIDWKKLRKEFFKLVIKK